jgi:hypothetical protein
VCVFKTEASDQDCWSNLEISIKNDTTHTPLVENISQAHDGISTLI